MRTYAYNSVGELPFLFLDSELDAAILSAVEGRLHQQLVSHGPETSEESSVSKESG